MLSEIMCLDGLDAVLFKLGKLVKKAAYYPSGHPSLLTETDLVCSAFQELLAGDEMLTLTIRRAGFYHNGELIFAGEAHLKVLSITLFNHLIRTLVILPDLSLQELSVFAQALAKEPSETREQGGFTAILLAERVVSLWVNNLDLSKILDEKALRESQLMQMEADTVVEDDSAVDPVEMDKSTRVPSIPTAVSEKAGNKTLEELIAELSGSREYELWERILPDLVSLTQIGMAEGDLYVPVDAFTFLCKMVVAEEEERFRTLAIRALRQLINIQGVTYLLDGFLSKDVDSEYLKKNRSILIFLRKEISRDVVDRLSQEESSSTRRQLLKLIVQFGRFVVPDLLDRLQDKCWYVVRNAVYLLGELAVQEAVGPIAPYCFHPHIQVRRTAVRALSQIGGAAAAEALAAAACKGNSEIRVLALKALQALKNSAAAPQIRSFLKEQLVSGKDEDLKCELIKTLGSLGNEGSLPLLETLLQQRKSWFRQKDEKVRLAAVHAVGLIGGAAAVAVLRKVDKKSVGRIRMAAREYLERLDG